ncbi:MAG: SusD/RagB family nutrient-binding outer membrane lipoprotein [Alistipes onderdonkii]
MAALVLVGTACTANYLDINTNPYEPSEDDMQTDGYIIGSALTSLASDRRTTDVNTAQFTDVLLGGPMGGYYSTTGGSYPYDHELQSDGRLDERFHV